MAQPRSLTAYAECEEFFERALSASAGIAVRLETSSLATQFIQKMNTYRVRLRRESERVYPQEDPRRNTCPYDHFKLGKDPADPTRVLIKPYRIAVLGVEDLPEE